MTKRKTLFRSVVTLATAVTMFLSACSSSDKAGDTAKAEKKLTLAEQGTQAQELYVGNGTEPKILDPHIATGVPESKITNALLEGLVSPDPKTLAPKPGIAESWEVSKDKRVFTFKIGADRVWSNGDPITAEDVRWSWERILSKKLASEYAYMLFVVKNAEKYNKGEVDFSKVGVKVVDEKTLEVTLKAATPYFVQMLTHSSTYPVHKASVLEHDGEQFNREAKWATVGKYISSGPFVLSKWETNKVITVEKNPKYWDASTVRLNKIHFYPIESEATEEKMYRSGQLHVTNIIPTEKIAVYKKEHPEELRISAYLGTYYYRLNVDKKKNNRQVRKALGNKLVRQALSLAIDRQTIVDNVTKAGELPAFSYTPPECAGYTSRTQLEFNPEKAKELLAKAGYKDGKKFPKLEILYNTSEGHKKVALVIQQMWKNTLGIDIELVNQDWKVYLDRQKNGKYMVSRAGWIGDYADPNTFLDMFVTGGGNNQTGWSNKKYDSYIRKASLAGPEERYELFQKAEEILLTEQPIIPIYYYTKKNIVSTDVKGWYANILDKHPYKHVYLESSKAVSMAE